MLDTFFTQIKVRSRMESGPIGPYLSECLRSLQCSIAMAAGQAAARFKPDDALLAFLASL